MRARKIKGEDWDVFETDSADGSMQIQMVDLGGRLRDDKAAIQHVLRRARRGDKRAIDALWEVLPYDGLVNRILWCEAMGWKGPRNSYYPDGFEERWGDLIEDD